MTPRIRSILLSVAALVGCRTPETPSTMGGLTIIADVTSGQCGAITGGRVQLRGTATRTVAIAPGTADTIAGLSPGAYTVGLEGLIGSDVSCFGETTGVQVSAGRNAQLTVNVTTFPSPTVTSLSPVTFGTQFPVSFSGVARADSYVVEWDTTGAFTNPNRSATTVTSLQLAVGNAGPYHIRARAANSFGSTGPPSSQVTTLVDQIIGLSAGTSHTCAVTARHAAYCWGSDSTGERGDGTITTAAGPRPVQVTGSLVFAAVSAGQGHSCGVDTGLKSYCWGRNESGQLGVGDVAARSAPTAVATGVNFAVLNAGFNTCAADNGGIGYCWGTNSSGQIGDSTTTGPRLTPTASHGGLTFAVLATSSGGSYTCGVTKTGAGYCWGDGSFGELGNGTMSSAPSPTPVTGGLAFATIGVGSSHSCGLTTAGNGYCWGDNSVGQLGDGTTTGHLSPTPVTGGIKFAALSVAHLHTCALTAGGAAYCWGANFDGQLGDGTTMQRSAPAASAAGLTFVALSTGGFHTCGATATGIAYCWGLNGSGQLGDGSTTTNPTPVRVSNP
jgi:alpha-tubulin suppressor-like RCC1 family protein